MERLVNAAATAAKVDEHGSWEFGAAFDGKGRGSALNWDLYGIGADVHTGEALIVIQIRHYEKRRKNWFASVRKNYFLLGVNEDGTTFAHCVRAQVVQSAVARGVDVILAVQDWIFSCDYRRVIRQGDLALIPARPAGDWIMETPLTLEKSHLLECDGARQNGHLYALNPQLTHLPGVHPHIEAHGWYRVITAKRADYWKFAAPTID